MDTTPRNKRTIICLPCLMKDRVKDDNSIYLQRLKTLYCFLFKLFVHVIFHGKLPAVDSSRLQYLKKTFKNNPVAHRGGFPEHTLTGFKNSVKHGVSVMEVDLNYTSDGHLVVFHDYTVDRTSNGTGLLNHMTLAETKALDVGVKYCFPNNSIPTLNETVKFAKQHNLFLILDAKGSVENTVPHLVDLFKTDSWLTKNVAVISFFPDILFYLKLQLPKVHIGLSCCSREFSHEYPSSKPMFPQSPWKQRLAAISSRVFYSLLVNWVWRAIGVSIMTPAFTDILNKRFPYQYYVENTNVSVIPWTINTEEEKSHVRNVLKLPFLTDNIP